MKFLIIFNFLICSVILVKSGVVKDSPAVCIPDLGCVEGIKMKGYQTKYFEAFLGVPYAQPPTGELRLANPVSCDRWDGTLKATSLKPDCIQKNYLLPEPMISGSEDCLYLNIYRPPLTAKTGSRNSSLPVMVYFYGGGFFSGSAHPSLHGPEYFMDTHEVILITVSYRLGALGFLSTGDDVISGNFGLKDQSLALKWIQDNIRAFGGNSSSVTIFGQSAGGVSVHMHMFSPLSEGLFHKAIVMSGNAAAPYNDVLDNPLDQARKQASFCGIKNVDELTNRDLLEALRKIDAETFVSVGDGFKYWHVDPLTTFRPVVEQNITGSFLIGNPIDYVKNGNYRHVPWMTGFVPYEGAVRALSITSNETLRNDFNSRFDYLLEKLLQIDSTPRKQMSNKIDRIVNFYLNGSHQLTLENSQRFGDMISDRAFLHPLYKTIKNYVKYADLQKNPVYLYKFAYKGPFSYSFVYTGGANNYGVVHCDDLIYLFRSPLLFRIDFDVNSTDAKVINSFVETFVTFAKTGEPKKWNPVRECTYDEIIKTENSNEMCDYQHFKNDPNDPSDFIIQTNNFYDMNSIKFWDEILENEFSL